VRLGCAITALLLVASCGAPPKAESPERTGAGDASITEIADNPGILNKRPLPREQISLRGVKLGDPESAIRESRIIKRAAEGNWTICRDGARYRIDEGNATVVTLGVWDPAILRKLNINSPADIESRFGKPESTDQVEPITIYRYDEGHLSVLWNNRENQLNAVNVAK
jgi:hypothetical protein